jgi:hypothetical protein
MNYGLHLLTIERTYEISKRPAQELIENQLEKYYLLGYISV